MTRNCVPPVSCTTHAHRRGLAPCEQRLVGLLLDVVVAVELRVIRPPPAARGAPTPSSCAILRLVATRASRAATRRSPRRRRARPCSCWNTGLRSRCGFRRPARRGGGLLQRLDLLLARCSSSCSITRRVPTTSGCSSVKCPQELVELGLLRRDSRVDLGDRDRRAALRGSGRKDRRLAGELALVGVARLLGGAQLEPRVVDVVGEFRHPAEDSPARPARRRPGT